ncbi:toprim domain-containing protein [Enterococcus casseliflavus]|nr:toprim domain-containing protein [Enterococcus casseliflavus]
MAKSINIFTEKQLQYARRANMFEYLLYRGEGFEKISSKTYEHVGHDSMRANVKTGVVTWFSQFDEARNDKLSSFDNCIVFAMRLFHEPYEQTVQQLLDFQSQNRTRMTKRTTTKGAAKPFSLANWRNKDLGYLTEKGRNYLASRFIGSDLISFLEKEQFITSDSQNNVLFKWYEFVPWGKNTVVGADVIGTYRLSVEKRMDQNDLTKTKLKRPTFKGIATGSKHTGGFYLSAGLDFKHDPYLFVFEAPLEALSYIELYRDKLPPNCFFHAMSGMKWLSVEERVKEIQAVYPETSQLTVVLCVNNDEEAQNFVSKVMKNYEENKGEHATYFLKQYIPKHQEGDWNEVLEYKITGRLASRELKEREAMEAQLLRNKLLETQLYQQGVE